MLNNQSLSMERHGLIAHNSLIYAWVGWLLPLCLISSFPMPYFVHFFIAQFSFIMAFCIFLVALKSLFLVTCCPLVASKLSPISSSKPLRNLSGNTGPRAESFRTVLVTSPGFPWCHLDYICSFSLLTQVTRAYMVALESFE